ncbi:hypothetical protein KWI83_23815 [Streptomyces sp. TRM70350]|nr:hypothetical protein [Streptomyces sp. TRM70350]
MRHTPTEVCAVAHIGQCSPDVYTVAARCSGYRCAADQCAGSNPGCRVRSPEATLSGPVREGRGPAWA